MSDTEIPDRFEVTENGYFEEYKGLDPDSTLPSDIEVQLELPNTLDRFLSAYEDIIARLEAVGGDPAQYQTVAVTLDSKLLSVQFVRRDLL